MLSVNRNVIVARREDMVIRGPFQHGTQSEGKIKYAQSV